MNTRLLSRMNCIGILHIRGGLGNQLFQLSAFSFYSKELNFFPIIYDYDLTLSSRDNFYPQYRTFLYQNLFQNTSKPFILNRVQTFIVRQLIKYFPSFLILDRKSLDRIALGRRKLPRVFIVRDSFEEDRYPKMLGSHVIRSALIAPSLTTSRVESTTAVHIRVAGYESLSSLEKKRLISIVKSQLRHGFSRIDIYSDDKSVLFQELEFPPGVQINWPESLMPLTSPELLLTLAQYKTLITNGSSLARWANFLAILEFNQEFVNLKNTLSRNEEEG